MNVVVSGSYNKNDLDKERNLCKMWFLLIFLMIVYMYIEKFGQHYLCL